MERWKINLYTVWVSQIIMFMSFSFGLPFLPFYIQELGITAPDKVKFYTALLGFVPSISMAIMSPIWGIAADRWGKKLMLLRAMLFSGLIVGAMSFVANADQLIALRFLQGIFTGTVTASSALVATSTPTKRLSFAIGFLSSSTFIGSSLGPVLGGFIVDYLGYRASFQIGGLMAIVDFFLVLFLIKEEKSVLKPTISEEKTSEEKKGFRNVLSIFSVMLLILLFIILTLRFTRSIFSPYLPLFVQERITGKMSPASTTGLINGVTGLMTALSGLTLSRLGDKYNKFVIMKILFILGIISAIPLLLANNLIVFTILYGIFFFFVGGLEPIVISTSTSITPPEKRGLLFGIQGLVGSIAMGTAPLLAGFVSIKFSIHSVLYLIPMFLIPGLICVFYYTKKNPLMLKKPEPEKTANLDL